MSTKTPLEELAKDYFTVADALRGTGLSPSQQTELLWTLVRLYLTQGAWDSSLQEKKVQAPPPTRSHSGNHLAMIDWNLIPEGYNWVARSKNFRFLWCFRAKPRVPPRGSWDSWLTGMDSPPAIRGPHIDLTHIPYHECLFERPKGDCK